MKFLCVYKPSKAEEACPGQKEMTEMGKFVEECMKSGVLLATEGCLPSASGTRIRRSEGKFAVIDGPFTESKEVIGGFALLRTASKQEAIEYAKRFMNLSGDGEVEVRQVFEQPAAATA